MRGRTQRMEKERQKARAQGFHAPRAIRTTTQKRRSYNQQLTPPPHRFLSMALFPSLLFLLPHFPHLTYHAKGHSVSIGAPSATFLVVAKATLPTCSLTSSSVPAASTTCQIGSFSISLAKFTRTLACISCVS